MASKELPTPSLSAYERRALDEIRAFKSPQAGWFDKAADDQVAFLGRVLSTSSSPDRRKSPQR